MKCPEIRELLEGYLEGILNEQDKTSVEEHLAICKGCSEELTSLRAYFKEVGSLEKVKAPDDFLEKVHERLERRSAFEKIMRTLFVPARVKIPLELAAVMATAVLAIFVYRGVPPPVQVAAVYRAQMAAKSPLEAVSVVEKTRPIEISLFAMPKEIAMDRFNRALLEEESKSPIIFKGETAKSGAIVADGALVIRRKALPSLQAPEAPLEKIAYYDKKEEELREKILWDTFLSVRFLVVNFEGKIISVGYDREKDLPLSLTAEIPSEHYSALLENLKQFGNVPTKPEPPEIREEERLTLTIKFELPAG